MTRSLLVLSTLTLLAAPLALSAAAQTQPDAMAPKTAHSSMMQHPGGMAHHMTKQGAMSHDAMSPNAMNKSAMSNGAMSHDAMAPQTPQTPPK